MPYADPVVRAKKTRERVKRWREKKHDEKYGAEAGDMRGLHGNHVSASSHYRWNSGRLVRSDGYCIIRVGVSHPLADPNGYTLEHHLVWITAKGPIPEDHVIHHRNRIRDDNRLENLQLLTTSEHSRLPRKCDSTGNRKLDGKLHEEYPSA